MIPTSPDPVDVEGLRKLAERLRRHVESHGAPAIANGAWSMMLDASGGLLVLLADRTRLEAERDEARRLEALAKDMGRGASLMMKDRALAAEAEVSRLAEENGKLRQGLNLADAALTEAEAILGCEYGDHYGVLCERMLNLRAAIASLPAEAKDNP